MRAHEGDEQHPRLGFVFGRLLAQPDLSARGDLAVVGGVHALAGTGHLGHLVGAAALGHVFVSHQAQEIAHAVEDVHADLLVGEAVVVVLAAEVQLADRDDLVAALPQQMMPARDRAVVGDGVVPGADLMHVLAGGECRARGHAHRAGRIGVREQRAACREPVEVGRAHDVVAVAAEHALVVLIRHDDQQVFCVHPALASFFFVVASYYGLSRPRAQRRPAPRDWRGLPSPWRCARTYRLPRE